MEFRGPDWKLVVLRGMHSYLPQIISAYRMEENLRHGEIEWVVELRILETRGQPQPPHPNTKTILGRYPIVFGDIPLGWPHDRGFEHIIELKTRVQAVITTPYIYLKVYQGEIERGILELLELGHIRPNSSPFSSSVILVIKKKDGTLQMCMCTMGKVHYSEIFSNNDHDNDIEPGADEGDSGTYAVREPPPPPPPGGEPFTPSRGVFYSLCGVPRYLTLQSRGTMQGHCVSVLVYSGATHKFIDA